MRPGCIICSREIMPTGFALSLKIVNLAEETIDIGKRQDLSASESRALVKTAIEKRYTAPA